MASALKFGYQLDFRNPPSCGLSSAQLYQELFQQIEFADQAGLDSVWLTEHHLTDDGYLSALMPTAAAIAARTRRVTIGTFVLLVPFYHPLRLAEDAAVVDVISNGRLRLGLGLGYRAEEFAAFGIPQNERLGRTLEAIAILKQAWTGERFSHRGRYFQFDQVRVLPKPVSSPYPELLSGSMASEAIRRAARLDLSFACNGGKREIAVYHQALRDLGKNPANYSVVNSRVVYVADVERQAWEDCRQPLLYQAELYGQWLAAAFASQRARNLIRPDLERLRRTSVLGAPAQVAERLAEIISRTPMTELILVMQLPGLAPAKAMQSLQRFVREVLPVLRG